MKPPQLIAACNKQIPNVSLVGPILRYFAGSVMHSQHNDGLNVRDVHDFREWLMQLAKECDSLPDGTAAHVLG